MPLSPLRTPESLLHRVDVGTCRIAPLSLRTLDSLLYRVDVGMCVLGTIASSSTSITWSSLSSTFNPRATAAVTLLQLDQTHVVVCYVDSPGGVCQLGTLA